MKQGWSCPSWHGSREQTQSGGTVRSSAKPSRDGRTCYRCLGWCGMREGGICSQCKPGFWSGFIPVRLICSSLWPDLIRRVRFLTSVFFFFFPMKYWIYQCPNIKTSLACFQHSTVDSVSSGHSFHVWLRLCLNHTGSFKGRALSLSAVNSLWMSLWAFSQRNLSKG